MLGVRSGSTGVQPLAHDDADGYVITSLSLSSLDSQVPLYQVAAPAFLVHVMTLTMIYLRRSYA
jgi:hypothetical protein